VKPLFLFWPISCQCIYSSTPPILFFSSISTVFGRHPATQRNSEEPVYLLCTTTTTTTTTTSSSSQTGIFCNLSLEVTGSNHGPFLSSYSAGIRKRRIWSSYQLTLNRNMCCSGVEVVLRFNHCEHISSIDESCAVTTQPKHVAVEMMLSCDVTTANISALLMSHVQLQLNRNMLQWR
jgi:hypothetical protein